MQRSRLPLDYAYEGARAPRVAVERARGSAPSGGAMRPGARRPPRPRLHRSQRRIAGRLARPGRRFRKFWSPLVTLPRRQSRRQRRDASYGTTARRLGASGRARAGRAAPPPTSRMVQVRVFGTRNAATRVGFGRSWNDWRDASATFGDFSDNVVPTRCIRRHESAVLPIPSAGTVRRRLDGRRRRRL